MADLPAARRDRIIALLSSWEDWIDVPGARAGWLSQPGEREEHTGKVSGAVCPECGKASPERGRLCDACWGLMSRQNASELRRLELEARLRAGAVSEDERRVLVSKKQRHYQTGSYEELEEAMRQLRKRQPYSYFILSRRFVDAVPFAVDEARLSAALRALSDLLPDLIRVPGTLLPPPEDDKAERDRRIQAWAVAGRSTRWIGDRVGLSHVRVSKIIHQQRALRKAA